MIKVIINKIAAIANEISNSPCSFAYTYKATVNVEPEAVSASTKLFRAWANPAVKSKAADSPRILPTERMEP